MERVDGSMIGTRWKNKVVKHLIFYAESREEGDFSKSG